ncbi:hypothetical protein GQ53DRAFT_719515 [Thozetella sp. PMI_491]|nr:hypothetical protein GQ53DRAFT_719515 [Thozetella sp. PMI_491]
MAPTAPAPRKRITARQKALARLADPTLPRKVHREDNTVTDSFLSSKKDKRIIKHSAFVSKIQKARQPAAKKRRRPSKKLVTTLETMADALADIKEDMQMDGSMDAEQAKQGKVRHHSLKSRPGALKRKEQLVRGEMQRFSFNLAQLATVKEAAPEAATKKKKGGAGSGQQESQKDGAQAESVPAPASAPSNRWAALRSFISSTMEQNPAFMSNS